MVFNDPILAGNAIPLIHRLYSTGGIVAAAIPPPPPSRPRKGNNSTPFLANPEAHSHVYAGQMALYAQQTVVGVYSIFHSLTESHSLRPFAAMVR